jgi:hypothetical protein
MFNNYRMYLYRVFQESIPNATVWCYEKCLRLKAHKLSIAEDVERWTVCTPVNVSATRHKVTFEYHYKALLETQVTSIHSYSR